MIKKFHFFFDDNLLHKVYITNPQHSLLVEIEKFTTYMMTLTRLIQSKTLPLASRRDTNDNEYMRDYYYYY